MKLNILYEDRHLLVCYKPAGVPVQSAGVGREDCVSILKNYLYEQEKSVEPYVGVVHRLDQPVEGVLVFARTPLAAKELSHQAAENVMEKYYLALCVPQCPPAARSSEGPFREGFVDNVDKSVDKSGIYMDFLLKNGKTNTSAVVPEHTKGAKLAKLEYEILMEKEGLRLVKIRLITGRHHQIRVQMAYHGNPLLGDMKYYPQAVENGDVDKMSRKSPGVALCAYSLAFVHPETKKPMRFEICPQHPFLKKAYEGLSFQ